MKLFTRVLVIVALFIGVLGVIPAPQAYAASAEHCGTSSGGFLGFPTWYKYLNPSFSDGACTVEADLTEDPTVAGKILLAVFEIMLRIGGIVAVIFVIYGSIQYIISQGEPENIKNARTTIINALVGLVITMVATGIVNLVGGNIK